MAGTKRENRRKRRKLSFQEKKEAKMGAI